MGSRRFEEMGRGWADTAHTTELSSILLSKLLLHSPSVPSAVSGHSAVKDPRPCSETVQAEFRCPSFLRLLRLFAAKPGPARFPIRSGVLYRGWGRRPVPRTYGCPVIAAAEVDRALTRRCYPFRLSPRIHISPTFNCTHVPISRNSSIDELPRRGIFHSPWAF